MNVRHSLEGGAWRACRGLLPLFLLFGFQTALAYTEAQDFFMRGVRAHDEGNCKEAVTLLSEAARRDGREALASFKYKGLNTEDYLPHFYLGRCYEKLGRTAEALESFRESERQGAIGGRASLGAITRASMARLESSLPRPTATFAPTPEVKATLAPPPTPVTEVAARPPVATAPPTPAAPPREDFVKAAVPAELNDSVSRGIRAFLQAEYEEAVKILSPLAPRLPQARAFLAYSSAGLFLTRGGDEELLRRAQSDYRQSRKYIRAESERTWISPAILRALLVEDSPQRNR